MFSLAQAEFPHAGQEFPEKAYLTGLLSLIDVVFNLPLPELLESLSIAPEIRSAIRTGEGEAGLLLDVAREAEQKSWEGRAMKRLSLSTTEVTEIYWKSVAWAEALARD